MHLVRILMFLAAHFDFWFVAKYVEGNANSLVDDFSCDNLPHFFSQVPKAEYVQQASISSTITPGPSGMRPSHLDIHRLDYTVQEYVLYNSSDSSNSQDLQSSRTQISNLLY